MLQMSLKSHDYSGGLLLEANHSEAESAEVSTSVDVAMPQ
jgi:hypothetical protein